MGALVGIYLETGLDTLRQHEVYLMDFFVSELMKRSYLRLLGTQNIQQRVGVFSIDCINMDNAMVADALEQRFEILTRCGLHCAPIAHKICGTFPQGTIRFSTGFVSKFEQLQQVLLALDTICG